MMTKVIIIKNEVGAIYQDIVYDYWVTCKLGDNTELKLFDYQPIDVSNYINKSVEIKIKALFIEKMSNENLRSFYGRLEKEAGEYYFINEYLSIQITKEDIGSENLPLNTLGTFYFGRLDLVSVKELNNEIT